MRKRKMQDDGGYQPPKCGPGWSIYQSNPEEFDLEEWEDLTLDASVLNLRQKMALFLKSRLRNNSSIPIDHIDHNLASPEFIEDLEFEDDEDDDHFSKVIDLLFELHELNYQRYKSQAKSLIKTKRMSHRIGQATISYRLTKHYCRYQVEFDSNDFVQVGGDSRINRRKRKRVEELTTIFAQCEAQVKTPRRC
jgi:hypothetical protein